MKNVAEAMGEGALKFGEQNWRKLDVKVCVNHAIRHLYMLLDGDVSEDHAGHAAANCLMVCELIENQGGE